MIGTRALLLASTLALASCSLAPKTVLPSPPVPQSWPAGDAYLLQSEAALPILSYQSVFTDPRLQSLAEQALTNNRDLRVAYANVAAARAQARVTRAGQFPAIGISGGAGYSDGNGNGNGNGTSGGGGGVRGSRGASPLCP